MFGGGITERHEQLKAEVREFAETEVAPRIAHMEATGAVEHGLAWEIARRGWIGVTIDSAAYGGMGAGHLAKVVLIEELARVCGAIGAAAQASQLPVAMIVNFGSEDQKQRWLPPISAGEVMPTIDVTEETSGSQIGGMQGRARRQRGGWVLTAVKTHVGNSHIANLHCVVVRTADSGPGSLSAFLVESDRDGVSVHPPVPAMALRGFSFGSVVFEDVWVPEENLLGSVGDGRDVADSASVLNGRANLGAVSLGIHRATVETTLAFAADRQRYGKPLSELGSVEQRLGQMVSNLMTAQSLLYSAADMLDRGARGDGQLMNAKLVNYELGTASAKLGLEVHAACGLFTDRPIERYFRDAHAIFAPAGTSDVQRLRLARFALGTAQQPEWSQLFAAPTQAVGAAVAG
ncbi:acyl-CoA dehydrogenase family protein [Streptomyces aureus]|uniref:acyl-CoA dehydrogenase family protein n=1 Tax=Streptomyces aureus TaxID=193461 RepID=UPI000690D588|nr:acyl-CoA dehydrogenase [Streptomyces aureus]